MNSEAATPDASSEVEKSGTSTVKVRRTKRLRSLFSELIPTERRDSLYHMSGMQDFSTYPGERMAPPAPLPSPAPATDGSKPELVGKDSERKRNRKLSRVKRRTSSRIGKVEVEMSPQETKLDSPSVSTPTEHRKSDLLSRSVVPSKARTSMQIELPSLPVRKCGDETIDDFTCGGHSAEEVIDSLPRNQRATAKPCIGAETSFEYVVNTGRVTSMPTVSPNSVAGMSVSRMVSGVKGLFSGHTSESFDGALLCYLLIFPCVGAVLLGALLLTLALMLTGRGRSFTATPRTPSIEQDSRVVCYTTVCQEVVALLALTADYTVPPCDDFYQHVCGRWEAGGGMLPLDDGAEGPLQPFSYEEANLRAFLARVHRSLEYIAQDPSRCSPRHCRMAHFYDSCIQFATDRSRNGHFLSVPEVLEQARVDRGAWQRAKTLRVLLQLVVATSLQTGLASAPSARRSEKGDVFIDVGESLSHVFVPYGGVGRFVHDSLAELREDAGSVSQDAVLAVDANVEGIRKSLDSSVHQFQVVQRGDLPPPLSESLLAQMRETRRAAGHAHFARRKPTVRARGLEKIGAIVELFGTINLGLARVYLLLLTSSHVVKYAYMLHPLKGQDRANPIQICLQATAGYFPGHFPFWLASTMETSEAHIYLDHMVARLKQSAEDMAYNTKTFAINGSEFTRTPVTTISPRGGVQGREVSALHGSFPQFIIQLSREPLTENWPSVEKVAQQQLRGGITAKRSVSGEGTVIVSSLFLAADLMHADDAEETLDYSTVGVRLLITWANTAVEVDNRERSNASSKNITAYRQCVADRITADTGSSLSQEALSFVLFLPWALDVALLSSTRRTSADKRVGLLGAKQRLFFRRFCQTTCGDAEAAKACRYGVLNSEAFSEAFHCSRLPLHLRC
ncbi:hypothetical protein HPB49_011977 [Dermacentor silvarum]|uniref:Uncharacterized protein n=1 Tax=Dermacentor silvarum TaxID=543639 RepID=A0ACB8CXA8_DERSI|nr:uncharacterized protein LOC119450160 [Dermacentor silvarum]KAH7953766.1 hypothetical protein HPB49_011977 [Dermacentor silvarum]